MYRRQLAGKCMDHPRSRGVYDSQVLGAPDNRGSSPLARGLPTSAATVAGGSGIIPARAGFTLRAAEAQASPWDHPRSRGVYKRLSYDDLLPVGSSPLARGLPSSADLVTGLARIIPARAGFTNARGCRGVGQKDHPRSRGVYEVVGAHGLGPFGSSPLARGLPVA